MAVGRKASSSSCDVAGLAENEIKPGNFRYINDDGSQTGLDKINDDTEKYAEAESKQEGGKLDEPSCDDEVRGEEFLNVLLEGANVPLDTQVPMNSRPSWADAELLRKGREFGTKYLFGLVDSQMLSLAILFSFRGGLEPLIFTGKSGTPYTAFQRYLSTVTRVVSWYESDVFEEGSEAHRNMSTVRTMHASVFKRMNEASSEELKSKVTMDGKETGIWCTHLESLRKDLGDLKADEFGCPFIDISSLAQRDCPKSGRAIYVNQLDLSLTQFGFVGLCILYPQQFGVHGATQEELRGFVHLWRCLGYLLGIKDRYNICSSGNLEVIRDRCRAVVEKWAKPALRDVTPEWEHMFRCVVEGVSYYVPGNSFSVAMAYLLWVLDVPFQNLLAKMTWMERMLFHAHRLVLNYMMRIPAYLRFNNFMLGKSLSMARNPSAEWLRDKREKVYDFQKTPKPIDETGS